MNINRRARASLSLAITIVAAAALAQCAGSSVAPTTTSSAVSGITLTTASLVAGASGQGTVSLMAAALSGGASISLTSSNPAVVTVQTPVTIPAGASSATFTFTAVAAGTATITASLNGTTRQSPVLTVAALPTLLSISLSASRVIGGNTVFGTATLTGPAPSGGASVALTAGDPIVVTASVTVPAGSTSAVFSAATRVVGGTTSATITGTYGGVSASAVLSVAPPDAAVANFGASGPHESETCELLNGGNTLNCTFNGSTSTAPGMITAYVWSYGVTAMSAPQTSPGPVLTNPSFSCNLMPSSLPPAGNQWFTMTVTLTIHDSLGNSDTFVDGGVRLLPQGVCGF